jgi:hypothetical protein
VPIENGGRDNRAFRLGHGGVAEIFDSTAACRANGALKIVRALTVSDLMVGPNNVGARATLKEPDPRISGSNKRMVFHVPTRRHIDYPGRIHPGKT